MLGFEYGYALDSPVSYTHLDVYKRQYIHGTNDTELLGTPASHGCIRLSPRDMMALFAVAEEGMDVFIQC